MIYEVNIRIISSRVEEYEAWLKPHVQEIIALPGFTSASVYRQPDEDGFSHFTMHYHVLNQEFLDTYLRDHAPRLRADAEKNFGGSFTATRRVLTPSLVLE